MLRVRELQSRFYPRERQRDPVGLFLERVEPYLTPNITVLDVGAGSGFRSTYAIKGRVRQIWGVDLDPRVATNPLLDRGYVADGATMPLPDNSVDVVFSIYVQEHIEDPASFARELFRVLKPGGTYLSLTPNRFHYVPLVAAITPTSLHRSLNAKRGRSGEDTFPTFYRLNTAREIERQFCGAGFKLPNITAIEVEPHYLKFHPVAYLAGVAYERLVNASSVLEKLRVNLITDCVKPA